tara:strand:- start:136 stop:1272 length:1137 start_codon:yes stop_codon:yes gene_type:complete
MIDNFFSKLRPITVTLLIAVPMTSQADVSKSVFGTLSNGETVEAFTLSNDNGITVRVASLGAMIDQVNVPDRNGNIENVVVALPNLAAYESSGSFNRTIGRFANRISGGKLVLDGNEFTLPTNDRNITMHGGPAAFGRKNWHGEILPTDKGNGVAFSIVSLDGESGFPGTMNVTVTYSLDNNNALRIDYFAVTDKTTVINLTNHTYFNLAGNAKRDVYDHTIQVWADEYTPADERSVPTGEILNVEGTPFDLRHATRIGDEIASSHPQMVNAKGYDHNFVLSMQMREEPVLAIRLIDPENGRQMDTLTTEPGVQIYTANNFNSTQMSANGTTLRQSYGIALETQHFPDSPNVAEFPTTTLRPGEEFHSSTVFKFSVID